MKEVKFVGTDKKTYQALVVYLPFVYIKNHRELVSKIVNDVQTKKKLPAFVVAHRAVIHSKADFKQKIPRNRTLTSVYDSILEDLVTPGVIIGKRSRYHLDGSLHQKISVSASDEAKSTLESRMDIIAQIYKQLTNRKISIEFHNEISYIRVPLIKAPKVKAPRKPLAKRE